MKLNVVGLGMVGLPTALLFAEAGVDVVGVDVDDRRLAAYRQGRSDRALEPDVAHLLEAMVRSGRIAFSDRPLPADAYIIAVGTPLRDEPDLAGVRAALAEIVTELRPGALLVLESTVPPGTTRALADEFELPAEVLVAHAPERVSPGNTLAEMRLNPRVVGGLTLAATDAIATLYGLICQRPIARTDATTAEFVKLIENTYRDVNIALANELLLIASDLGIDMWDAADLANTHPRVHIHRPGPGVGGHCIGVAPLFLRAAAPEHAEVLMAARQRNLAMPGLTAAQLLDLCATEGSPRVAVLGIAYKANVADDRDSPSLAVAQHLRTAGAEVRLHDPLLLPGTSLDDAVAGADCLGFLVPHAAYAELEPERLGRIMRHRTVLDAVHGLDRRRWEAAGFDFAALAERPRALAP